MGTRQELSHWFDVGVIAGQSETHMRLEETLKETLQMEPGLSLDNLLLLNQQQWEQTDYFNAIYGKNIFKSARKLEPGLDHFELYEDLLTEFWKGYSTGTSINIRAQAKTLIERATISIKERKESQCPDKQS